MTKTKRLEKEVQDMIANDYGKIKAKILAEKHNCTLDQVYEVGRRYKLQQKQNLEVEIDEIMNQILLSGIIGDGRIKYNGLFTKVKITFINNIKITRKAKILYFVLNSFYLIRYAWKNVFNIKGSDITTYGPKSSI